MRNVLSLLALVISSIALALTVSSRKETPSTATTSVPLATVSAEGSQRISDIEKKIFELSNKLQALERSSSVSAVSEIDANLETTLKATTKNTAEVEKVRQQVARLTGEIQSAFSAVAQELGAIRGELTKVSEAKR